MYRTKSALLVGTIVLLALASGTSVVRGANQATINVTVTIQSVNVSVSASGPIGFGVVSVASVSVAGDSSHVVNDGNTAETYSLNLANPGGWTAVRAAPGADQYCLSAQFNSFEPTAGSFTYSYHALSTTSTACTYYQFAGNQTGVSVPISGIRYLWFKFEAPTSTSVTTEQTIVVTVTAAAA